MTQRSKRRFTALEVLSTLGAGRVPVGTSMYTELDSKFTKRVAWGTKKKSVS